jgi:NTP pyrophosphatase (non-canonical NTP hydrolase)
LDADPDPAEAVAIGQRRRASMRDFQSRVLYWMVRCFTRKDAFTPEQRAFRFIEEALELVQAVGTSREDVLRLVDYVYGRPVGNVIQEIGGVMVTVAGLASACSVPLDDCAENELARCGANTEQIRAKDLAKPERSSLPGSAPTVNSPP